MKWWQRLAFLVVGGIAAGVFLAVRMPGTLPQIQVVVPGEHELTLDEVGTYTIFWESRSVVGGTSYSSQGFSGLTAVVTSVDSGRELELHSPSASMTYNTGSRAGESSTSMPLWRSSTVSAA